MLLQAHTNMPVAFDGIKRELPSYRIPNLFLAANLDESLPHHTVDPSGTPTPSTSAPGPSSVTEADGHRLRKTDSKLVESTES